MSFAEWAIAESGNESIVHLAQNLYTPLPDSVADLLVAPTLKVPQLLRWARREAHGCGVGAGAAAFERS
jgi:hypothetical protein